MTSSLVGSEMCIRDSRITLADQLDATLDNRERLLHFCIENDLRILNTPVSYTHLTLPTICSV
eukprot:12145112-Prorocentrum_lima.AAC.1